MSLRHRHEYAVDLPRGLPDGFEIPAREFPASPAGAHRTRPRSARFRAGGIIKGRKTPVPRVLLSLSLAGPAPSGSTDTSRLCQGRSRPPRHHPDQAALSYSDLLRQARRRRSLTSTRTTAPHGATRRRSSRRGPPRCFYPRPGLLLPDLDRAVVPLGRAAGTQLAAPAAPPQQVPGSRDGVLPPEPRGDQVADPGQGPPLVFPARGRWTGIQHPVQLRQLIPTQPAPSGLPPGSQPGRAAGVPGPPPPLHRPFGHPQLNGDVSDRDPLLDRSTAASRTSSRRLRPSAVNPPPCAYLIDRAYRRKPRLSALPISSIKDLLARRD